MSQRYIETGKLSDLELEEMKLLVNALEPRAPRGAMTVRERHRREREWLANMGPLQLAVWTEYMLRNMSPKDTIIYEGAMQEWVLPEIIHRLSSCVSHNRETILSLLTALKEGRNVRW